MTSIYDPIPIIRWLTDRITQLEEQNRLLAERPSPSAAVADPHDPSALPRWPHYFSTYCIHGHHDDCRRTCKHCHAQCQCSCHHLARPRRER